VFLENAVRRMEKFNEPPLTAAIHGAREISFTIVSMTLSLAAVFLPLLFMSGLVGRIFREFAVTIIVSIFASGLVSLTLTPLMCARLLAARGHGVKKTIVERTSGAIEHWVLSVYGKSLWFFLRHRWVSALTWIACFVGTIWLFGQVPKAFLPVGDSSFVRGVMIAEESASPAQMHTYQTLAERAMQQDPAVKMTFSMSGNGSFIGSNMGFLLAFLDDPADRPPLKMPNGATVEHPPINLIAGDLMGRINSTSPGIFAALQPNPVLQISTGATATQQGQFAYAVSGINPDEVYATAQKMMGRLYAQMGPGKMFQTVLSDLFTKTPNLQVNINREQAKMNGVSESRILTLLRNAYSQNYVYLIKRPNDQYQVILEIRDDQRNSPDDLGLLYIKSDDGKRTVPLSAVATWEPRLGPQAVNHINQFTSVTIFFNLNPGVPIGNATDYIEGVAKEVVPTYIRGELQGEAMTFRNTVRDLVILMVLAVFVMYVILGILYESYLHPITVLSSLPVALVGGLLTLWLFNEEASLYAFVGMFMLMGIVKKNGIMIVDFANQRVAEGQEDNVAIHEASMDRFRPIIMTTLAALMGALPIALGYGADGASRRPLGLVIIGGLIVSQFITLYITPAIYLYLEDFQEHVLDRYRIFSFFRSTHVHHGEMPPPAEGPAAPTHP
jgi:HAE1 family hydrophobic/amphiphilic exporter-1